MLYFTVFVAVNDLEVFSLFLIALCACVNASLYSHALKVVPGTPGAVSGPDVAAATAGRYASISLAIEKPPVVGMLLSASNTKL